MPSPCLAYQYHILTDDEVILAEGLQLDTTAWLVLYNVQQAHFKLDFA